MPRLLLISIITILLCSTTPAKAETVEFRAPGRLTYREHGSPKLTVDLTLDADGFLTDRQNIDHCNMLEKGMRQCTTALGNCETRECEECISDDQPLFGSIGLPWIIGGGAAVLTIGMIIGVVIGIEASRPATAPAP